MNLKEALIALAEGKKVRRKEWDENKFLVIGFNDNFHAVSVMRENDCIADYDLYGNDWEIYYSYDVDFHEAIFDMYENGYVLQSNEKDLYRVNKDRVLERSVYLQREGKHTEFCMCGSYLHEIARLKFRRFEND